MYLINLKSICQSQMKVKVQRDKLHHATYSNPYGVEYPTCMELLG